MALKKRPSEPFWVVFEFDPALTVVSSEDMRNYLLTKDIAKLPIDLITKSCTLTGEAVAMARVKPMSREAFTMWSSNPVHLRNDVVRTHVVEVHNIDGAECRKDRDIGDTCLTEESLDNLDENILRVLFTAVSESASGANGEDRPFSLPDGYAVGRLRSLQLPANAARLEKIVNEAENEGKSMSDLVENSQSTDKE